MPEPAIARSCPALFLTAPASHQGKTTLTAGLARHHRNRGRTVRVFKTGPDFLDPCILERASGNLVYSLDLWMAGEADCRRRLYDAAADADLILIEGSMGLFDGTPSSADLAAAVGVPVVPVIDATGMAQTFAAVAHGLSSFRPQLPFHGVLANRVASARHAEMLLEMLPPSLRCVGTVMRDDAMTLPERHLGLVQAQEIDDLEQRIEASAARIALTALAELPPPVIFEPAIAEPIPPLLAGIKVAVARDAAFSFIYPANLELLAALGADIAFFSPLANEPLPMVDAAYLPGGYPELHAGRLAGNRRFLDGLRAAAGQGRAVYGECGGYMVLGTGLTDAEGHRHAMAGLLPVETSFAERRLHLGYRRAALAVDTPLGTRGTAWRGHEFHYASILSEGPGETLFEAWDAEGTSLGPMGRRAGPVFGSFFHLIDRV